jgi:hypothetical protein
LTVGLTQGMTGMVAVVTAPITESCRERWTVRRLLCIGVTS